MMPALVTHLLYTIHPLIPRGFAGRRFGTRTRNSALALFPPRFGARFFMLFLRPENMCFSGAAPPARDPIARCARTAIRRPHRSLRFEALFQDPIARCGSKRYSVVIFQSIIEVTVKRKHQSLLIVISPIYSCTNLRRVLRCRHTALNLILM